MAQTITINPPGITEEQIRSLKKGDMVSISGIILTGRDTAHKYIKDNFLHGEIPEAERETYEGLKKFLHGGILYHAGPVVLNDPNGQPYITAVGPTTSLREEPYEYDVIKHFGVRAVIGKGGMGEKTLSACKEFGAVYLHAIGGAAAYTAKSIRKVHGNFKPEFGTPEAFWILEVENLECVVTMDAHGESLHADILQSSSSAAKEILGGIH